MSDLSTNPVTAAGTAEKKYTTVVGLEIHAELKTHSKMFCSCKNDPDEIRPNHNVCPICMGHPGTLPTINKEAVRQVIRIGNAVGGNIADFTEWDRKNYFYPDIPKGYQISQYAHPLVRGGSIAGVDLTRIHLEEDTASSVHDQGDFSLVDFNRSSLPLMELVTEPVIHDAKTAGNFARELQLLLRYLGAGDANMEKGEMRVEANISVTEDTSGDPKKFGTRVEVKNLNSFKSVERAIDYEVQRHIDLIERGGKVVQETRGFDESTGKTFSQRAKEDSHDYRYFPDPDLPKLFVSEIPEFAADVIKAALPELPWEKRARYIKDYGMKDEDAEMFVQDDTLRMFFESVVSKISDPAVYKLAINYITSDIAGLMKKTGEWKVRISPEHFVELILMIFANELSSRSAKDILSMIWEGKESSKSPKVIAEIHGMIQKNDPEALKKMIEDIVAAHPSVLADYKAGKQAALQFFIGQIMKQSKGSVNPAVAREILIEAVDK
ncbi:MAG: Asp-tRNA(Asn)/Glu-tRNA(Gln) amidotransferase subunit GatB [Patescibacteria group bacterium]